MASTCSRPRVATPLACRVHPVLAMTSLLFRIGTLALLLAGRSTVSARQRFTPVRAFGTAQRETRPGAPAHAAHPPPGGLGWLSGCQHRRTAQLDLLHYMRADAQRPDSAQFERTACIPSAASVPGNGIDGRSVPRIRG